MAGDDRRVGLDQREGVEAQGFDVQDLLPEVGVGIAGWWGYGCNFGALRGLFGEGDLGGEAVRREVEKASAGLEGLRRRVGFGERTTEGVRGADV